MQSAAHEGNVRRNQGSSLKLIIAGIHVQLHVDAMDAATLDEQCLRLICGSDSDVCLPCCEQPSIQEVVALWQAHREVRHGICAAVLDET